MELTGPTLAILLAVAIGLAAVAIGLSVVAIVAQRRTRAAYRVFAGPHGVRDDVLTVLERHLDEVRGLRGDVADLRGYADELRALLADAVSRVATVRYDAFEDMGGRMSFSCALLDEHGNGMVITAINGRTETRTYAKPVREGGSRHNLSGEELEAIRRARSGYSGDEEIPRRGPRPVRSAS